MEPCPTPERKLDRYLGNWRGQANYEAKRLEKSETPPAWRIRGTSFTDTISSFSNEQPSWTSSSSSFSATSTGSSAIRRALPLVEARFSTIDIQGTLTTGLFQVGSILPIVPYPPIYAVSNIRSRQHHSNAQSKPYGNPLISETSLCFVVRACDRKSPRLLFDTNWTTKSRCTNPFDRRSV